MRMVAWAKRNSSAWRTALSTRRVALQLRTGLDVLTDGEMRRYAFYGHLIDAVEGFDKLGGWSIPFRNEAGEEFSHPRPVVVSRMRRKRPMCAEVYALRARTNPIR